MVAAGGGGCAVTVSRSAACRFLVRLTGLGRIPGERPEPDKPDGVVRVVSKLGYVQVDPMQVLAKNQDLVLAARVEDYTPGDLERALYVDRWLVEVVTRNRCIVPVEEYPLFQVRFAEIERRNRPGLGALEPVFARVLARVREEGPLSSLDFDDDERVSGWWEPDGRARTRAVRQALEWLWHFGRVAISHRVGSRRYFDLPERLYGPGAERHPYTGPDGGAPAASGEAAAAGAAGGLVRKYFLASGLVDVRDWAFGWSRYTAAQRRRIVERSHSSGELARVKIEGGGPEYYVPGSRLEELRAAGKMEFEPAVHILPPLDNLIWLRDRLADLFGFEYTWEAYLPAARRRYGPYTCPVLHGDRFVGRVDLRADRKAGELVIRGVWWEPCARSAPTRGLRAALERLAGILGATGVSDPEGLLSG